MKLRALFAAGAAAGILASPSVQKTSDAAEPVERLTAFAVDMGVGTPTGRVRTGTIDIVIDRWSTDQERDRLLAALRESGTDGLMRALQKVDERTGTIQTTGNLGYPLRFARQIPLGDGRRRILLATDRPVSFLEARNQPRTMDYPFLVIDIRLGPDGKGEGKLLPLAKITQSTDHLVEIENYAAEPVRLTQVRKVD